MQKLKKVNFNIYKKFYEELDLCDISILGDVLDVGKENYGIVYNLTKSFNDEVCVDYFNEFEDKIKKEDSYQNAILFFNLCKCYGKTEREDMLKEVSKLLVDGGDLFLWDVQKKFKEMILANIDVKLPNDSTKKFQYKDFNMLNKFSLEDSENLIKKYFSIEETKVYDKIYFIKAKKKGRNKDEGIINSCEL